MINNILISRETRKVISKDNRFIGIEGENLQEVLVFNLDEEIEGQGIVEIQFRDETTGYIEVEKTERGYELPVKSSLLTQEGIIKMQLKIVQAGQEVFKSEIIRFDVDKAINATETIPEQYPTWIDNLEILKLELQNAESERVEAEKQRATAFTQMQKDTKTAINNIEDMTEEYNTNAEEKTKEFNENVQAKIDEYNENVKVIEPRIVELETQVAELQIENTLLKNQFPTGQAEGENITLNDSSDMEFKELRIGGNSWQETREGRNKFNAKNIKYSNIKVSDDGKTIALPVVTSGNGYTDSASTLAYLCPELKVGDTVVLNFTRNLGNTYNFFIYLDVSKAQWNVKSTRTITQDDLDSKVIFYANRFTDGETEQCILTDFSIMLTSEIDTNWEQYGAMPSPEFPSEIQNVNGSANITVCNNNFFDYKNTSVSAENATQMGVLDNGYWYKGNKSSSSSANAYSKGWLSIKHKFLANTNYKMSFNCQQISAGVVNAITIKGSTDATSLDKVIEIDNTNKRYSVNINSSVDQTIYIALASNEVKITDIMVTTDGSTDYIPHQSQQITFPLAEGQRMYKDSYLADDGVHHKRGRYYLKNANFALNNNNENNSVFQASDPSGIDFVDETTLCNIANYRYVDSSSTKINTIYTFMINNNPYIRMSTVEKTLEEFKSMIEKTDAYIEHKLFEEVIEPYTEEQQKVYEQIKKAHSYKNVTHIFSTDEIKPIVKTIYRKDLETLDKNKEERLLALENAILGGN